MWKGGERGDRVCTVDWSGLRSAHCSEDDRVAAVTATRALHKNAIQTQMVFCSGARVNFRKIAFDHPEKGPAFNTPVLG